MEALALIAFPVSWQEKSPEVFERLRAYRGPVLAVCGEDDDIAPPGPLERLLTDMGLDFRLEVLPGAGHLFEESRKEVGRLVAEFMAEELETSKIGPRSEEARGSAPYPAAMAGIPAKRLLVYIVSGLVVLAVGGGAVMAMRSESSPGGDSSFGSVVEISAVEGADGSGTSDATIPPDADLGGGTATQAAQTTTTTKRALIFVQVAGAVRRPGVYEMPPESRVFQAIDKAGGFTADADEQAITLAACLSDGCRVYVPEWERARWCRRRDRGAYRRDARERAASSAAGRPLSINSAGSRNWTPCRVSVPLSPRTSSPIVRRTVLSPASMS